MKGGTVRRFVALASVSKISPRLCRSGGLCRRQGPRVFKPTLPSLPMSSIGAASGSRPDGRLTERPTSTRTAVDIAGHVLKDLVSQVFSFFLRYKSQGVLETLALSFNEFCP
jgi:hypothetical protein